MVRIASLRSCSNCILTMCVSPRNGLPASIVYHERSKVVSPATALDRLRSSCGEAAADGQVLRAAYAPAPGRRMTSAAAATTAAEAVLTDCMASTACADPFKSGADGQNAERTPARVASGNQWARASVSPVAARTARKHSTAEGMIAEPMKCGPSNFSSSDLFDGTRLEPETVVIVCTAP